MSTLKADIVICGAGIAGLWLFNYLKRKGFNALLLENDAIGCGQTIASQGIIHSGLKYVFTGQVNELAKSISAMPALWRKALKGEGPVDLSAANVTATSQHFLFRSGFKGSVTGFGADLMAKAGSIGNNARRIKKSEWPASLTEVGFSGTVLSMDELVLDMQSVLHALAAPYQESIRKADMLKDIDFSLDHSGNIERVTIKNQTIIAKRYVFTAASANKILADRLGHGTGLETQVRPLLMGMMQNAPCELFAHCMEVSPKPVVTITTHRAIDGKLIWYLGGSVAERSKDSDPRDVFAAAQKAFRKYMPSVDLTKVSWSTLPIDRVEGKSKVAGHLPNSPTIHIWRNAIYGWPTKLSFSPILTNQIAESLSNAGVKPSGQETDWSFLPKCSFTQTPWDLTIWKHAT
ncbi:MAG: FAD-dependent oxidoreductase [Verrucomicrobia bacterium]|nr:FAD-dependent oxidoreductase [Verrucomicrobiota bacterium]